MKIQDILLMMAAASMFSVVNVLSEGQRPDIQMPIRYALRTFDRNLSTTNRDVVSVIVRDGDRWRVEIADPNIDRLMVWIGKGTNLLTGSSITPAQQKRIPNTAFVLDKLYRTVANTNATAYRGVVKHNTTECWSFVTDDNVSVLIDISTRLVTQTQWDSREENYTVLNLSSNEYEWFLSATNDFNARSLLKER